MPDNDLYTVQIVFNSAQHLPVADLLTLSCDPYVLATVVVPSSPGAPDDPPLTWRTPTIQRTRDPTWNNKWIVSGIPSSGFRISMKLIDEDPGDRDDRMGKALAVFEGGEVREGFEMLETEYKIEKRKGSFRPWIQTYLVAVLPGQKVIKHNRIVVSVKVLGKALDQSEKRPHTIGPNKYSQHFSPLIGSVVNKKPQSGGKNQTDEGGHKLSATTFIANKLQLTGPVPKELRHPYVAFKPIIRLIFDNIGITGHILNLGLRKQYRTLYSHNKATLYGVIDGGIDEGPRRGSEGGVNTVKEDEADNKQQQNGHSTDPLVEADKEKKEAIPATAKEGDNIALVRRFLQMTAWGRGGRLFTYVIMLDGEWRFTETGDEFAINMLSKHSMHSDAARVIAFSGEFFVRRIEDSNAGGEQVSTEQRQKVSEPSGSGKAAEESNGKDTGEMGSGRGQEHKGDDHKDDNKEESKNKDEDKKDDEGKNDEERKKEKAEEEEVEIEENDEVNDRDPKHYELVIDNDSGTYRPKKDLLPILQTFLAAPQQLGALGRVTAMDGFDETLKQWKAARKEEKKRAAGGELPRKKAVMKRGTSVSSVSSGEVGDGQSLSSGEVQDVLKGAEAQHQGEVDSGDQARKSVGRGDSSGHPPDSAINI